MNISVLLKELTFVLADEIGLLYFILNVKNFWKERF